MTLEQVNQEASRLLNQVAGLFKDGVKLTLIARTPGNDEADFMLTNDNLHEAGRVIGRRMEALQPPAAGTNQFPDPDVKVPRLFYYEEAENAWCPVPVDIVILDPADMDEGEEYDIRFQRKDMTEAEFDALPEG